MQNRPNKRRIPGLNEMKTYHGTISPDRLNPIQFLVHSAFLDEEFGGDESDYHDPVDLWPTKSGRYNIHDGTHRSYNRWLNDENVPYVHPYVAPEDYEDDSPLRMEDVMVVRSGQEGEEFEVADKDKLEHVRKHGANLMEEGGPVWFV